LALGNVRLDGRFDFEPNDEPGRGTYEKEKGRCGCNEDVRILFSS